MEERIGRIEDKLDKLLEVQTIIQIDVAEHIRRTELAEQSIERISEAIQPIQHHVALVNGIGSVFAWLLGLAAAAATIYAALK